jgi:hypothetical protein
MKAYRAGISVFILLILISAVALTSGCNESKPVLTSISPTSGAPASEFSILGKYFGKSQKSGSVKFGTATATIMSWADTKITATIPDELKDGQYGVAITTSAGTSNVKSFTIQSQVTEQQTTGQQTQANQGRPADEQIIYDYFAAINAKGYQDAYQMLTAKWKSIYANYEQFVASYREYISSVTIRSIKKLPEFSSPGKGMFQVELEANYIKHYPAGSGNIPEFYVLVPDTNNPGQWLIDSAGAGP